MVPDRPRTHSCGLCVHLASKGLLRTDRSPAGSPAQGRRSGGPGRRRHLPRALRDAGRCSQAIRTPRPLLSAQAQAAGSGSSTCLPFSERVYAWAVCWDSTCSQGSPSPTQGVETSEEKTCPGRSRVEILHRQDGKGLGRLRACTCPQEGGTEVLPASWGHSCRRHEQQLMSILWPWVHSRLQSKAPSRRRYFYKGSSNLGATTLVTRRQLRHGEAFQNS